MGVYKYTKIGPYIEITGDRKTTLIKVKRICPKHPKKEQDGKFCSQCGTLVENVEYPVKEEIYPLGLLNEDSEDDLYSPEGMDNIILSNDEVPSKIKIKYNEDPLDLTNINLEQIKEEQLEWMFKENKIFINILRSTFGEDNVHLKWGIITYWS